MNCKRPGCKSEIPVGRRKYCSSECSKIMNRKTAALRADEAYRNSIKFRHTKMGVRRCLSCGKDFLSEGPWNRICPHCSERNASVSVRSFGASMGGGGGGSGGYGEDSAERRED
ncbi:MAG: hypothetical protein HQ592_10270 [Planctomycetes bacterium]|nr:hypothetical protein [Planctomycetota bacterium]